MKYCTKNKAKRFAILLLTFVILQDYNDEHKGAKRFAQKGDMKWHSY